MCVQQSQRQQQSWQVDEGVMALPPGLSRSLAQPQTNHNFFLHSGKDVSGACAHGEASPAASSPLSSESYASAMGASPSAAAAGGAPDELHQYLPVGGAGCPLGPPACDGQLTDGSSGVNFQSVGQALRQTLPGALVSPFAAAYHQASHSGGESNSSFNGEVVVHTSSLPGAVEVLDQARQCPPATGSVTMQQTERGQEQHHKNQQHLMEQQPVSQFLAHGLSRALTFDVAGAPFMRDDLDLSTSGQASDPSARSTTCTLDSAQPYHQQLHHMNAGLVPLPPMLATAPTLPAPHLGDMTLQAAPTALTIPPPSFPSIPTEIILACERHTSIPTTGLTLEDSAMSMSELEHENELCEMLLQGSSRVLGRSATSLSALRPASFTSCGPASGHGGGSRNASDSGAGVRLDYSKLLQQQLSNSLPALSPLRLSSSDSIPGVGGGSNAGVPAGKPHRYSANGIGGSMMQPGPLQVVQTLPHLQRPMSMPQLPVYVQQQSMFSGSLQGPPAKRLSKMTSQQQMTQFGPDAWLSSVPPVQAVPAPHVGGTGLTGDAVRNSCSADMPPASSPNGCHAAGPSISPFAQYQQHSLPGANSIKSRPGTSSPRSLAGSGSLKRSATDMEGVEGGEVMQHAHGRRSVLGLPPGARRTMHLADVLATAGSPKLPFQVPSAGDLRIVVKSKIESKQHDYSALARSLGSGGSFTGSKGGAEGNREREDLLEQVLMRSEDPEDFQESSDAEQLGDLSAEMLPILLEKAQRKGKGGRTPAQDPRLDPKVDPKKARRILANRMSAARSKLKQKLMMEGLKAKHDQLLSHKEGYARELQELQEGCSELEERNKALAKEIEALELNPTLCLAPRVQNIAPQPHGIAF